MLTLPRQVRRTAAVAVLAAVPLAGQVNIEELRDHGEQEGDPAWQTRATLSAELRTGSVDREEFGLDLRSQHHRPRQTWLLLADGELGWQDGRRYSNQGLLHLRRSQRLTTALAWELFVQADYARQRRLDRRALAGSGARWQLGSQIFLGLGAMLEHEVNDLPPAAVHPRRTSSLRLTSYVSGNRPVGGGHLSFTAYAQPRVDAVEDLRLLADARLRAPLSEDLALTLTTRLRHDADPVDGVDGLDLWLTAGLAIDF